MHPTHVQLGGIQSVYAEIYLVDFMPLANPAKIEGVFLFVERFQESGNALAHSQVSAVNIDC